MVSTVVNAGRRDIVGKRMKRAIRRMAFMLNSYIYIRAMLSFGAVYKDFDEKVQ